MPLSKPAKAATPDQANSDQSLLAPAIIIAVGILATTLGQVQMLARLPLQNLLKNQLHVDRSANAAFFFWIGLPWYFKPIVGIITDAFPIFDSRRKNYITIFATLTVLSWVVLYFTPHNYNKMLWACLLINCFMVFTSTAVGAYMVEAAQASSGSGRLTAVRNFIEQLSYIIMGPVAGLLASIAFGWTIGSCGLAAFLVVPAAIFFMREKRVHIESGELLHNAGNQLSNIVQARTMWAAAGLMALFYIAPGISTAIFYRQQNLLHMSTEMQGFQVFLGGAGGVLAATGYAFLCKRYNLRKLLIACMTIATLGNLAYVFYTSVNHARIIDGLNGWAYTLAELVLMDLAVRSTPAGSEGLGFALMMAVRNFALFGTDWFGSMLLDHYHFTFNSLVYANSFTTFITVPLVLLLPLAIVGHKDSEPMVLQSTPEGRLPA